MKMYNAPQKSRRMTNNNKKTIHVGDTTWALLLVLSKTNRIGDTKYNI